MAKILLLEDEEFLADTISDVLEQAHHAVEWVKDGDEAYDRLRLYDYEVAILDWSVPGLSGLEVCQKTRLLGSAVKILMLTGKSDVADKVAGLDSGADDYLTKPFSSEELLARVRGILRRPAVHVGDSLKVGSLELDLKGSTATKSDQAIILQAKELAVLTYLMRHKEQYLTAEELLKKVWSSESDSSVMAVRKCIARLREKLDLISGTGTIVNHRGLGYKISEVDNA